MDIKDNISSFEQKLTEKTEQVKKSRQQCENALNAINESVPTVTIERNFVGLVKTESIEHAFANVYTTLRKSITPCADGITSLYGHINDELELIVMLSRIDLDLYHLLNESTETNVEVFDEIKNRFGKREDDIATHLKESVERILILRNRLNSLKQDITNVNNQLQKIHSNVEARDNYYKKVISEYSNKLSEYIAQHSAESRKKNIRLIWAVSVAIILSVINICLFILLRLENIL